jgi:NitT/TauT family transport system permease protein
LNRLISLFRQAGLVTIGIALLLAIWWLGAHMVASNPRSAAFAGFAPGPAFAALAVMLSGGELWSSIHPSLLRIGAGIAWAAGIGIPLGIVLGRSKMLAMLTHLPFQFLRMISPLAWMPVAVLAFATWDGAIIFLIAAAAIWPITFSTAAGLRKVDPQWFKVARNLGARFPHLLSTVILPAVATDILTGLRLALGVAWIILVPAEFLGVTSGLGYAINDARDTLAYDHLAATVLVIGALGFALDAVCLALIRRFAWVRN